MKINKNIVIPAILTVITCAMAVIISKMPILLALSGIIAMGTILLAKEKLHLSYIMIIIFTSVTVFLYIGVLVVLGSFSEKLVRFPY